MSYFLYGGVAIDNVATAVGFPPIFGGDNKEKRARRISGEQ